MLMPPDGSVHCTDVGREACGAASLSQHHKLKYSACCLKDMMNNYVSSLHVYYWML